MGAVRKVVGSVQTNRVNSRDNNKRRAVAIERDSRIEAEALVFKLASRSA
jgi:hypothetical protein